MYLKIYKILRFYSNGTSSSVRLSKWSYNSKDSIENRELYFDVCPQRRNNSVWLHANHSMVNNNNDKIFSNIFNSLCYGELFPSPLTIGLFVFSPFSVQPKSAYLNPNEKIDIRIGFKTMLLGEACGILRAIFETGIIHTNFRIFSQQMR